MSYRDIELPVGFYNSDDTDLLTEIVSPVLAESVEYLRSVAYLKESFLVDAAQAMAVSLENDCHYKFLIGSPLGVAELDALASSSSFDVDTLGEKLRFMLDESSLQSYAGAHLVLLQYLVASRRLEIKLSLREDGLHHPKMRIATDVLGNQIVTLGSDNDSRAALRGGNKETGVLFASWVTHPSEWERTAAKAIRDFETDWDGNNPKSIVLPIPEQLKHQISLDWESRNLTDNDLRECLRALYRDLRKQGVVSGEQRHLRGHQERAIQAWVGNSHKGIIAHCTGAGKTFTTLYMLSRILEQAEQQNIGFAVVVAVPYVILAEQWADEVDEIGASVHRCWGSSSSWILGFSSAVMGMNSQDAPTRFVAVVVNDTLRRKEFQTLLHKINTQKLMFVGDEVHRHGAESYLSNNVVPKAAYMLGLSATPWSRGERERQEVLTAMYGPIVDRYSLEDAIEDKVLCEYYYYPNVVSLNAAESEQYALKSRDIAALENKKPLLTSQEQAALNNAYRVRASILASCEQKFEWLDGHLAIKKPSPYSLFYSGPGDRLINGDEESGERLIDEFSRLFDKRGWNVSKITADDSAVSRRANLRALASKTIHCMLAIRILDEGFDMPACQEAFILASSNNERQFVQRRGRVLRQSSETGKKNARIHDLIVTPRFNTGHIWQKTLVTNELIRAYEFAKSSLNWDQTSSKLQSVAVEWDIDFESDVIAAIESGQLPSDEWAVDIGIVEGEIAGEG